MQVRTLLYKNEGAPRDLLVAIATALDLPLAKLLSFEGRPLRALYTERFCGGAVIPLGDPGKPANDVHIPLAHQSALAGVLAGRRRCTHGPERTCGQCRHAV